jgi:hypothetical protein
LVFGLLCFSPSDHFDEGMALVDVDNACLDSSKFGENCTQVILRAAAVGLDKELNVKAYTRNLRDTTNKESPT